MASQSTPSRHLESFYPTLPKIHHIGGSPPSAEMFRCSARQRSPTGRCPRRRSTCPASPPMRSCGSLTYPPNASATTAHLPRLTRRSRRPFPSSYPPITSSLDPVTRRITRRSSLGLPADFSAGKLTCRGGRRVR